MLEFRCEKVFQGKLDIFDSGRFDLGFIFPPFL